MAKLNKDTQNQETNQPSNFMLLSVILVILIAALSFGTWYVWQKNKQQSQPTNSTDSSTQPVDTDPQVQEPTVTDNSSYLVIEEWGIKVPLGNLQQSNAEYGMFVATNGQQTAFFTSKVITDRSTNESPCALTPVNDETGEGTSGGLVSLTRFKQQPSEIPKELHFEHKGWWYALEFSNGGACYEGDTGQESGEFKQNMEQALRRME